jgi:hypothetical protein
VGLAIFDFFNNIGGAKRTLAKDLSSSAKLPGNREKQ